MSGTNVNKDDVKSAAAGRAVELLEHVAQINRDVLDGAHHPCPKCGGKDRFRLLDADAGSVFCGHCFNEKNGDFLAAISWSLGCTFPDALEMAAAYLGLDGRDSTPVSVIDLVARDKRMPRDAFLQFGVTEAERKGKRVARVDVYDAAGKVHSYFDLQPGDKGKFRAGKGSAGMFFPGRLPAAGETWCVVEGVKDSAALVGLGLNAAGMATCRLNERFANLFRGVHVILVPDLDSPAWEGVAVSGGNLTEVAASVRVARLPGQMKATAGDDVRDVLKRPDGEQLVLESIRTASEWTPPLPKQEATGKPRVVVSLDEAEVAREVVEHLGRLGWESPWVQSEHVEESKLYQRSGRLTQLVWRDDADNASTIGMREIPNCILRERITQCCELVTQRERDGTVVHIPVTPPKWLIESVSEREQYGRAIRPLAGVTYAPTIRPDGSIVQSPGYDAASGLYFHRTAAFPLVDESPSRDDAIQAAEQLFDVIADFPFVSEADRSAWLAMLISMVARPAIAGCVPLFAVTANTRGAGKSLLVDAAANIAYGRAAARKSYTNDPDETRKMVTATLLEASPTALLDNVDVRLGGAALDAALTSATWNDRILGTSKTTGDLPAKTIWAATGNNLSFGSDVARRVLPIRLMSPLEKPETRSGFAHPNLMAWVADQRPRFATAALTLVRAYFAAGCPFQPAGEWGSYEAWSGVVRNAIVWAGIADPLETREHANEQDETAELLGLLVCGLEEADPDRAGLTTQEIERLVLHRPDDTPTCPSLVEAASLICGPRFNVRVFGRRLGSFAGRVWQNRRIEKQNAGKNRKRWVVVGELGESGELNYPFASAQKNTVNNAHARVIEGGKQTHQTHQTHPGLDCDLTDDAAWEEFP